MQLFSLETFFFFLIPPPGTSFLCVKQEIEPVGEKCLHQGANCTGVQKYGTL